MQMLPPRPYQGWTVSENVLSKFVAFFLLPTPSSFITSFFQGTEHVLGL